jgi:hypothetical protein
MSYKRNGKIQSTITNGLLIVATIVIVGVGVKTLKQPKVKESNVIGWAGEATKKKKTITTKFDTKEGWKPSSILIEQTVTTTNTVGEIVRRTELGALTTDKESWSTAEEKLKNSPEEETKFVDPGTSVPKINYEPLNEGWRFHQIAGPVSNSEDNSNTNKASAPTNMELGALHLNGEGWRPQVEKEPTTEAVNGSPVTGPKINYSLGGEGWKAHPVTLHAANTVASPVTTEQNVELGALHLNGEGWKPQIEKNRTLEVNNSNILSPKINYSLGGEGWKAHQAPTSPTTSVNGAPQPPTKVELGALHLNGEGWRPQVEKETTTEAVNGSPVTGPKINYSLEGEGWKNHPRETTNDITSKTNTKSLDLGNINFGPESQKKAWNKGGNSTKD